MSTKALEFWTVEGVRSALGAGARWVRRPDNALQAMGGASVDTRTLQPGNVFFSLRGATADGHHFVAHAAARGAALAVVEDESCVGSIPAASGMAVVRVESALAGLVKVARAYRKALEQTRVVAVTGSAGKTTTTRLIDGVLKMRMKGSASIRSFNNRIGVSLTVLNAGPRDQYLVSEVGTSGAGEIAELAAILEPNVAVITNIGRAHLEGLKSVEGVAAEKAALVQGVRKGGCGVIPTECAALEPHVRGLNLVRVGMGENADVRVVEVIIEDGGVGFVLNDRTRYRVGLIGRHNALNAAMAVAVGRRLGLGADAIAEGLAQASGAEMRLGRERIGGVEVINDAYNANPESMLAAVRTLAEWGAGRRRIAVLGDMLELGEASEEAHREVMRAVRDAGIEVLVAVGPRMCEAAEELRRAVGCRVELVADLDSAGAAQAAGAVCDGDVVLVKASRGMRLERVVEALRARVAEPAA